MRRNVTLTIQANGILNVSNTTRDGIYNYKGSIVNDGDIHVFDVAYRGIYNYNNGANNVGIMYFTNNGDILVENTPDERSKGEDSQLKKSVETLLQQIDGNK